MGVFATRSPFRPNPVGLSVVALKEVVLHGKDAPYLIVTGADLMDGTPIYDIKPYLPHIDSHPEARGGFAVQAAAHRLHVVFPEAWLSQVPAHLRETADGTAGAGSPPVLPARPGTGVRFPLCRHGDPVHCAGGNADSLQRDTGKISGPKESPHRSDGAGTFVRYLFQPEDCASFC